MKKSTQTTILQALVFIITVFGTSCKKTDREPVQETRKTSTAPSESKALAAKPKKVLFIGIDGCIWRAITATNAPTLKTLMNQSYSNTTIMAQTPTWSSNGWAALFTGVGVAKHKATSNSFSGSDFVNYPSFFRQIKTNLPALRTVSVVNWAPIHDYIIASQDVTVKATLTTDAAIETRIIQEVTTNNSDVTFCYFHDVDKAGHASTFRTSSAQYMQAVKTTDGRVGRVLAAVKGRSAYANEDWLIVVSTDHGGDASHGGSSDLERNTFVILNNSTIAPRSAGGSQLPYTVPPTILNFLKIPRPSYYDGQPLVTF